MYGFLDGSACLNGIPLRYIDFEWNSFGLKSFLKDSLKKGRSSTGGGCAGILICNSNALALKVDPEATHMIFKQHFHLRLIFKTK